MQYYASGHFTKPCQKPKLFRKTSSCDALCSLPSGTVACHTALAYAVNATMCRCLCCQKLYCSNQTGWPCSTMLCCAVPCCAALCCAVPCCAVPCRAVPCRAVLCCAVPHCTVSSSQPAWSSLCCIHSIQVHLTAIPYSTCAIPYSTCAIPYSTRAIPYSTCASLSAHLIQ